MKTSGMKLSKNVMFQTAVHKVRPKQKIFPDALREQIKDDRQLLRMPLADTEADKIHKRRQRIRIGDR